MDLSFAVLMAWGPSNQEVSRAEFSFLSIINPVSIVTKILAQFSFRSSRRNVQPYCSEGVLETLEKLGFLVEV
jgi:hypothetical protein